MSTDIPSQRSDQIYAGALIHTRFNLRITTKFHLKYNNLLYAFILYLFASLYIQLQRPENQALTIP